MPGIRIHPLSPGGSPGKRAIRGCVGPSVRTCTGTPQNDQYSMDARPPVAEVRQALADAETHLSEEIPN